MHRGVVSTVNERDLGCLGCSGAQSESERSRGVKQRGRGRKRVFSSLQCYDTVRTQVGHVGTTHPLQDAGPAAGLHAPAADRAARRRRPGGAAGAPRCAGPRASAVPLQCARGPGAHHAGAPRAAGPAAQGGVRVWPRQRRAGRLGRPAAAAEAGRPRAAAAGGARG
ncbi:MAG: hypothetical protein J3K34DRAFT_136210 [Monoraphidium minutum]|nr:MAG: hypothetical protein J3K34DRAFT_136210 [Monoraphidium minutum]